MKNGDKLFMLNSSGLGNYEVSEVEATDVCYANGSNSLYVFLIGLEAPCINQTTMEIDTRTVFYRFAETNVNTRGFRSISELVDRNGRSIYRVAFYTDLKMLESMLNLEMQDIQYMAKKTEDIINQIKNKYGKSS